MTNTYEIYRQDTEENNIISQKIKRYHTQNKATAFRFMDAKNRIEGRNVWRVAIRIQNIIILDVDSPKIDNLKTIAEYYSKIFGEMEVWKTNGGYHIHSKKRFTNDIEWSYNTMKVLNPLLESADMMKYAGSIRKWYDKKLKEEFELKLDKKAFLDSITKEFPMSGLYCGVGNFDTLFALNVVLKGYYCIRISKKHKDDRPYKVSL